MRSAAVLQIGIRLAWRNAILAMALLVFVVGAANAASRVPYGQGLLWKIEHPGVAPSYVFGTMHVNDPRVRTLPAPVRSAFNHAERTVYEIVITPDVRKQLTEARYLPEGRTLDEILGSQLFDDVATRAEKAGISRDRLRRIKPWAVAGALHFRQGEIVRSYMGELPLDQWMQTDSLSRGAPVLELETVQEHIDVFDDMAEADQIALLRSIVENNRQTDEDIEEMTQRYVARDVGAIYAAFQEEIEADETGFARKFALRLIDDRNHNMVARMQDLLRQGGTFIAVGALHLPGDQGILRLLQRQGYSIVRVY